MAEGVLLAGREPHLYPDERQGCWVSRPARTQASQPHLWTCFERDRMAGRLTGGERPAVSLVSLPRPALLSRSVSRHLGALPPKRVSHRVAVVHATAAWMEGGRKIELPRFGCTEGDTQVLECRAPDGVV